MSYYLFIAIVAFLGLVHPAVAVPSGGELGELLGYPASEIIIENYTESAKQILQTPTLAERRKEIQLPSGNNILLAYKIYSRKEQTFYPIYVFFSKPGVFLNTDVQGQLEKIEAFPEGSISKGGRGPFGRVFQGLGEGGIYSGEIKVSPQSSGSQIPSKVAALISILRPDKHNFDVKIAIVAALDQGKELVPIREGEKYYESFRPPKDGEADLRYNLPELMRGLHQIVASEYYLTTTQQPIPPSQPKVTTNMPPEAQPVATVLASPEIKQIEPNPWSAWVWIVLAVLVLSMIAFSRKYL